MSLLEILWFTLGTVPSSSRFSDLAFLKLRAHVALQGEVKDQYYGTIAPIETFDLQEESREICWVIRAYLGNFHSQNLS